MGKSYVISDVEFLGILEALHFASDNGLGTIESVNYETELGRDGLHTFLRKRGIAAPTDTQEFAFATSILYDNITSEQVI